MPKSTKPTRSPEAAEEEGRLGPFDTPEQLKASLPPSFMTERPQRTWIKCEVCGATRKIEQIGRFWVYAPCGPCMDRRSAEYEELEQKRKAERDAGAERARAARIARLETPAGQSELGIPPDFHGAALADFPKHAAVLKRLLLGQSWLATLHGGRGVGKTRAAYALCRNAYASGQRFVFRHVPTMIEMMRLQARDESAETKAELMRLSQTEQLLVLDDLGAEKGSEYSAQQLTIILDARAKWHYTTVITTELTMEQIKMQIADRIASRLSAGMVLHFHGRDWRLGQAAGDGK